MSEVMTSRNKEFTRCIFFQSVIVDWQGLYVVLFWSSSVHRSASNNHWHSSEDADLWGKGVGEWWSVQEGAINIYNLHILPMKPNPVKLLLIKSGQSAIINNKYLHCFDTIDRQPIINPPSFALLMISNSFAGATRYPPPPDPSWTVE